MGQVTVIPQTDSNAACQPVQNQAYTQGRPTEEEGSRQTTDVDNGQEDCHDPIDIVCSQMIPLKSQEDGFAVRNFLVCRYRGAGARRLRLCHGWRRFGQRGRHRKNPRNELSKVDQVGSHVCVGHTGALPIGAGIIKQVAKVLKADVLPVCQSCVKVVSKL